jgi:hypothetical protein
VYVDLLLRKEKNNCLGYSKNGMNRRNVGGGNTNKNQ